MNPETEHPEEPDFVPVLRGEILAFLKRTFPLSLPNRVQVLCFPHRVEIHTSGPDRAGTITEDVYTDISERFAGALAKFYGWVVAHADAPVRLEGVAADRTALVCRFIPGKDSERFEAALYELNDQREPSGRSETLGLEIVVKPSGHPPLPW